MKPRAVMVMGIAIALVCATCRPPGTGGAQDRSGIISLVPAATEILFEIGAGGDVVGVSDYCTHPAAALDLPRYGGYLDPQTERIVSSGAQTVVMDRASLALVAACRSAGIRVVTVGSDNLADMERTIAGMGELTGRKAEAAALAKRLRDEIAAAAALAAGKRAPSVAIVVDRSPDALEKLFVAGGGSLPDDLMRAAGMMNVFGSAKRLYPMVSLESILVANPEVIVDLRPLSRSPADAVQKALEKWRESGIMAPEGPVAKVLVLEATDFTVVGPRVGAAARLLVASVLGVEAR